MYVYLIILYLYSNKQINSRGSSKPPRSALDGSGVDWSNLPTHLCSLIARGLKSHIEILRFRSVCHCWRCSIPPFLPPIPPKFPYSFSKGSDAYLSKITVYLLRPDPTTDPSASSSSPSSSKGWLLKMEEMEKVGLLNPLTNCVIRYSDCAVTKDSNFFELNMVELGKASALKYTNKSGSIVSVADSNKVIVSPNSKSSTIFLIDRLLKMGYARIGDKKPTFIQNRSSYNDMIVYKNQCYVVDTWGTVFWIDFNCNSDSDSDSDSALKVVQFSPLLVGFGQRKHLVECCGELYVVDRHLRNTRRRRRPFNSFPGVGDFKVYKLDEEWGRWVDVKCLGDYAFFLTADCCFSVSARELNGCKGNCIYFTNQNDGKEIGGVAVGDSNGSDSDDSSGSDGCVFSLEDHSIQRVTSPSQMFWPPSAGLLPKLPTLEGCSESSPKK